MLIFSLCLSSFMFYNSLDDRRRSVQMYENNNNKAHHTEESKEYTKKTVRSQFFSLPITTITLHVLFSGCQEIKNSSLHSWQLFQAKTNL